MPKKKVHTRDPLSSEPFRQIKRLRLSIDTLLRVELGLPLNPDISCHQPVSREDCIVFLKSVADQENIAHTNDPPTQGYEPNADTVKSK